MRSSLGEAFSRMPKVGVALFEHVVGYKIVRVRWRAVEGAPNTVSQLNSPDEKGNPRRYGLANKKG